MNEPISRSLVVLGASILLAFIALGWLIGNAAIDVKRFDRTVAVKGLSEREVPADVAIWPLTFQDADNDLNALFESLQRKNGADHEVPDRARHQAGSHHGRPAGRDRPVCAELRQPEQHRLPLHRDGPRSPCTRTTSRPCARP